MFAWKQADHHPLYCSLLKKDNGGQMKRFLFLAWLVPAVGMAQTDFDFLIGQHDVTLHAWTGNGWTPPRPVNAEWHGERGLRDAVIQDEWFDPDPKQGGSGINIRMFDAAAQDWKMMWISTSGKQVQDLRAKLIDGVLTMWQVYPEREGWKAEFEVLDQCRWARADYVEQDGEWMPRFRLVATRRDCVIDAG